MTFEIPEGLAPEVYPLAWLLGSWRGPGFIAYPDIDQRAVFTEAVFSHDGGPYLAYAATTWLLESPLASLEGELDLAGMRTGEVWSAERGYWRVAPPSEESGSGGASTGAAGQTELEVLLSEPSGYVSVFLGAVAGARIELRTDLVARTATGAEVTAATRMYGLVGGELYWATDLAAFGHELQSYSSGRMQRQE